MSTGKVARDIEAEARAAWRKAYPNVEKRRAKEDRRGEVTFSFSAEQMEEAYNSGYHAACDRGTAKASALVEAEQAVVEAALYWDSEPGIRDGERELAKAVMALRASSKGTP